MNYTDDDLDDLEYGKLNYDEDQDLITRYNYPLYIKRSIQELQGLAAAIIYDSTVDVGGHFKTGHIGALQTQPLYENNLGLLLLS